MPRTVNRHVVVSDEPTTAPITTTTGSPVYWQQIRTLTLANGDIIYGCAHCDYTADSFTSVRPHLNRHRDAKSQTNGQRTNGSARKAHSDGDVETLLEQLSQLQQLRQELEHYKARALKAEGRLQTVRDAIGSNNA